MYFINDRIFVIFKSLQIMLLRSCCPMNVHIIYILVIVKEIRWSYLGGISFLGTTVRDHLISVQVCEGILGLDGNKRHGSLSLVLDINK